MRVAIVHELLTMKGGAERVAKLFADMFPDAPVYTLLYDEKKLGNWFPAERMRTSRLQKWAWLTKNHHYYLSRFPCAVEAWDFSEFDLVISSSSAFAHGIITNGKPKHISYIHSPARYLWDRHHDVANQMNGLVRPSFTHLAHKLRVWDSEAADRADLLLAASKTVQRRIELYWRKESEVVYPPIDDAWFTDQPASNPQNYFLVVSTLARYKRIDLAIDAANALQIPLKIVGEGPDKKRLQKRAGNTVEFLGHKNIDELKTLYANAQATIFPGDEDFGLVPLESMACGTPVIAYKSGGALETVNEKTGLFFTDSLSDVMRSFDRNKFDQEQLMTHAQQFNRTHFEGQITAKINAIMK